MANREYMPAPVESVSFEKGYIRALRHKKQISPAARYILRLTLRVCLTSPYLPFAKYSETVFDTATGSPAIARA